MSPERNSGWASGIIKRDRNNLDLRSISELSVRWIMIQSMCHETHITEDGGPDCDVSRRHSLLFLKCLSFFPSQTFIDVYLVLGPCTFSFTASAAKLVSALCSRFETFTAETSSPHAAAHTIQGILDLALTTLKAGFTQKVFKNRFEKKISEHCEKFGDCISTVFF